MSRLDEVEPIFDDNGALIGLEPRYKRQTEIQDVQIGKEHFKGSIMISDVDLRKLVKKVETLSERVAEQDDILKQQTELINAIWYHPGMPGANEIEQKFKQHVEIEKSKQNLSSSPN